MAWSTRQIADLAGTTLRAVRHYHEIGLLDEPERAANGYKQYGTAHLVRLLQIIRLKDVGVPLSQMAAMIQAEEDPEEAIRALDAEIAATIERLQRVRMELAIILQHHAPMDVPAGFEQIAHDLSESDRRLIMVYSRIFNEEAMEDLRAMLSHPHETDVEFNALPAEADDIAIRDLAERMAPEIQRLREEKPWISNPADSAPRGETFARSIVTQAIADLYNPAQRRVLKIANELISQQHDDATSEAPGQSSVVLPTESPPKTREP